MSTFSVMLACSAGGHLAEMRQLHPFYERIPHSFVTFRRPDTESLARTEKVHFIERPARNPFRTIRSLQGAWGILKKEKPRMIISTGADVTVPVCIAAKLQGIPFVFIESFCRPSTASWTGRILSLFADKVIYQWKELEKFYPHGVYGGSIFVTQ